MFDLPSADLRKKNGTDPAENGKATASGAKVEAEGENKLNVARWRLELLFDSGTFEEIGAGVVNRSTDFGLEKKGFQVMES